MEDDSKEIFICECGSYSHQTIFWYDKELNRLTVSIHLSTHKNIFKRILYALKYIVGFKSRFGAWDEFIFNTSNERRLLSYLKRTSMTFKQQLEIDIIPNIGELIEREKAHLAHLKSLKKSDKTDSFIKKSTQFLFYFQQRQKEYKEYAKELKL